MGMVTIVPSLRKLSVRHIDSDEWIKVGHFEMRECKKLRDAYAAMGLVVHIDKAPPMRPALKPWEIPSKVSVMRFAK